MTIALNRVAVTLGGRAVVDDVSAHLDGGRLIGILGPNGAGKSTLVRALLGLVPHAGAVVIDGVPRASLSRTELARRVAYLPQGETLHWPVVVERLVALGRLPHLAPLSRPSAHDRTAIEEALWRTDVAALRHRTATELSGGERVRVLLARALAVQAAALVVDEPLASLDPAHRIEVMELLRAEADAGTLVLCVLHDLTAAARYCDRLLVLDRGTLVADGVPRAVLTAELLAGVYGIAAWAGDGELPIVPVARVR